MAILGVGLDISQVERIGRILSGPQGERFAARCFTENERGCCDGKAERFAARFAAKEALYKALCAAAGGPFELRFQEAEVFHLNGVPKFRLAERPARAVAQLGASIHLSMTHDGVGAAVVIVEAAR